MLLGCRGPKQICDANRIMEINQLKRTLKDLQERTESLRGFL